MWKFRSLPLGEIELVGLSVAVQGVHLQNEVVVIRIPLILVMPVSWLHLDLPQLDNERDRNSHWWYIILVFLFYLVVSLWRERNSCLLHHFIGGVLYDNLMIKRIFANDYEWEIYTRSKNCEEYGYTHNLELLLYKSCGGYPTRSECTSKKVRLMHG